MNSRPVLALMSLLCALTCQAEEYFGEYKDPLKGEFVPASPRPKFKLANQFRFSDPNGLMWTVPARQEVDGASIPQAFWTPIGGPFDGAYIKASVVHDYYCITKERTQHDTHRNFFYGMRSEGVPTWKAKLMYWAVATFGPKWELNAPRTIQNMVCNKDGKQLTCTQQIVQTKETIELPGVDLNDPTILAAAQSKAAAVARTLKTSNGEYLDISAAGAIPADLDSLSANAERYRKLFSNGAFLADPRQLGVLSSWDVGAAGNGVDQLQAWAGNKLPTLAESEPLTSDNAVVIATKKAFTLGPESVPLLKKQPVYDASMKFDLRTY